MAEVKVLIEGYTNADSASSEEEKSRATSALIKDGNIIMVSDPGILDDQKILIDKLKENNLTIDNVNIIFITHSHIDHYRNIGMFPDAKTLEFFGFWDKETAEDWEENFTNDIQILKTPGHSNDGLTLLVKTENGVVAVCGDVFWKENFPEDDQYASNKEQLRESRKNILAAADYIIPGHGKIFKTNR